MELPEEQYSEPDDKIVSSKNHYHNQEELPHNSGIKRPVKSEELDEIERKKAKSDKPDENRTEADQVDLCESEASQCCSIINQLPVEVLQIIFESVPGWPLTYRMNMRLVCKLWFELCNPLINELRVVWRRLKKDPQKYERLADFQFPRLKLFFRFNPELDAFPLHIWEKIGTKIHSLEFSFCRLGNEFVRNVIPLCDNLQSLLIRMRIRSTDTLSEVFCSPDTLEGMNVIQRRLKIFKITLTHYTNQDIQKAIDYRQWEQVFKAFFEIFPNVTNYSSNIDHSMSLECLFLERELNEIDRSKVSLAMAFSLSACNNWRRAVEELSTVGELIRISLDHTSWQTNAEEKNATSMALFNFFARQKNLRTVKMRLNGETYTHLRKTLLFHILGNCSHLCDFIYEYDDRCKWWANSLTNTEFSSYHKSILKVKNRVRIDGFEFKPQSSSLSVPMERWYYTVESTIKKFRFLLPGFSHLQHLDLKKAVSDQTLQRIFKFLTNLKTLRIYLNSRNTSFGITGSLTVHDYSIGCHSINQLLNLELLEMSIEDNCIPTAMADSIFSKLNLPKLKYLYSFSPTVAYNFTQFGLHLPLLKVIHLTSRPDFGLIPVQSLLNLAQHAHQLCTMKIKFSHCTLKEAKEIFKTCPTLRFLSVKCKKFYYDPLTDIVKRC